MKTFLFTLVTSVYLAACTTVGVNPATLATQPEGASGYLPKPGWSLAQFAVAAANPLATEAGYRILKAGGSATDAAIAVQMVLSLVEPQSSGIGGGAFLLHFNGKDIEAFDGRETAPAGADENLFLAADSKPITFMEAVVGGRSVGIPGTVRMLEVVHQRHGKLPWPQLFEPAITLADEGFNVSARLNALLQTELHLKKDPIAAAYFYNTDGTPHATGDRLRNPALADILRKIASGGSKALHEGIVAQSIVNKVNGHTSNPGKLSMTDLADYRVKVRTPLCHDYQAGKRDFLLCGFPPPSSGAIAIGQILGMLNHTGASALPLKNGQPTEQWLHLYTDASRLAFADRAHFLGDPDFVNAPAGQWMSLLDPAYLAVRARLIDSRPKAMSLKTAQPGAPGGENTSYAPMNEQPEYGTSHISIVDAEGHAVAMTSTIEDGFGSRLMVNVNPALAGGFLLNNELTDFSFLPKDASGTPVANRVQAGKRPRSSMSPTLVFDKLTGALLVNTGSPGGAMIIHYTAKTLYGILNWGLSPQEAINLPNFGSLNGPTLLEEDRFSRATVDALNARGHDVKEVIMTSGLQALAHDVPLLTPGWLGGADPRREGVVIGD